MILTSKRHNIIDYCLSLFIFTFAWENPRGKKSVGPSEFCKLTEKRKRHGRKKKLPFSYFPAVVVGMDNSRANNVVSQGSREMAIILSSEYLRLMTT